MLPLASAPCFFFGALLRSWWLPVNASAHGVALDRDLRLNLWIMLLLFLLSQALLVWGMLRKRRTLPTHRQAWIEWFPLALLAVLFFTLAIRSERLWAAERYTGADLSALQVEVTGMQFVWYFRYPGKDATFGRMLPQRIAPGEGNPLGIDPGDPHGADDVVSGELVLPANREVDLALHSQDVIHGFAVPEMRLKQNATPGQTLHLHFTPTAPGTYAILCTQVCGLGHFRMQAKLRVLPPAEFGRWIAQHEAARAAITAETKQAGSA